ncbi:unnamed protein product (macronuclear) [Paramecium tetraurelia]|uniref:Potassium channel domain-containing protein n=1 Tax=Paramecium tetraurelia TaxID=5888 RepID=A0BE94_PARTE|nr:uncharacterized protein GSPATT00027894001 [Paramecium tetraurelia]CAK56861.1 unnamed protein product [Paramecium tetraurelia]|eukprot:XP_001424259.1 hypothetical protein (macronuclear) [Paramecium tetraurelia strain d4-2]
MRFIKIIHLLGLAKLKLFFDKIEDAIQLNIMLSTIVSFVKLSQFVLFWSRWLGCIFHNITVKEASQDNWLHYYGIYEEDWSARYINSLYWAYTTIYTVGYGDFSLRTSLERLFGIFFLIIATVVLLLQIALVDKKAEIRKKSNQSRYRIKQINTSLLFGNKRLSLILKIQPIIYFMLTNLNLKSSQWYYMSLSTFTKSNCNEKCHILISIFNCTILGYYPLQRCNFKMTFLEQVTKTFKQYTALYIEFIFFENEPITTEKHLYLIQSGNIEIILQRCNQKFNKLEYKGLYWFLYRIIFYSIFYIDKSLFQQLLKSNQIDLLLKLQIKLQERFHQIKNEIKFNKGYHQFNAFVMTVLEMVKQQKQWIVQICI